MGRRCTARCIRLTRPTIRCRDDGAAHAGGTTTTTACSAAQSSGGAWSSAPACSRRQGAAKGIEVAAGSRLPRRPGAGLAGCSTRKAISPPSGRQLQLAQTDYARAQHPECNRRITSISSLGGLNQQPFNGHSRIRHSRVRHSQRYSSIHHLDRRFDRLPAPAVIVCVASMQRHIAPEHQRRLSVDPFSNVDSLDAGIVVRQLERSGDSVDRG